MQKSSDVYSDGEGGHGCHNPLSDGLSYENDLLHFEGVAVRELAKDYGSPLLLLSERKVRENCDIFRQMAEKLQVALPPRVCFTQSAQIGASAYGCAGFLDGGEPFPNVGISQPKLFASVSQGPTLATLSLLARNGVGFLVQSWEEMSRAIRAGIDPRHMIFCGPFKDLKDLEAAWRAGVGAIELESWEEIEDLELANLGTQQCPVRVCLRIAAPWQQPRQGLQQHEMIPMLERLRNRLNLSLVGFSAGWDSCGECSRNSFAEFLQDLRSLAEEALSYQHNLSWLMVGVRAYYGSFNEELNQRQVKNHPPCSKVRAGQETEQVRDEFFYEMQRVFDGANFAVYFSLGNALFQNAAHLVTAVLRQQENNILLDMPYMAFSEDRQFYPIVAASHHTPPVKCSILHFWAKEFPAFALKRMGLLAGSVASVVLGDLFLLADVADNLGHFQSYLGGIASAVELLISEEGEVRVMKRRPHQEDAFQLET